LTFTPITQLQHFPIRNPQGYSSTFVTHSASKGHGEIQIVGLNLSLVLFTLTPDIDQFSS